MNAMSPKNTQKHTPGPWIFDGAVGDDYLVSAQVCPEESASYIAPVGTVDGDWAASEANARLIAAAPELLEALKAALPALEYLDDEEALKVARAVIAKAEGVSRV